jgi:hypothetical protein
VQNVFGDNLITEGAAKAIASCQNEQSRAKANKELGKRGINYFLHTKPNPKTSERHGMEINSFQQPIQLKNLLKSNIYFLLNTKKW